MIYARLSNLWMSTSWGPGHKAGGLSSPILTLKAGRIPGEPLVFSPWQKAVRAGLQCQWRMTDTLTIKGRKGSRESSSVFLQFSLYLGHRQKVLSTRGESLPHSVHPSRKYPVRPVQRNIFSLIPEPTKLTTKIGHYNKAHVESSQDTVSMPCFHPFHWNPHNNPMGVWSIDI